jgi:hypothetical protein
MIFDPCRITLKAALGRMEVRLIPLLSVPTSPSENKPVEVAAAVDDKRTAKIGEMVAATAQ